MRNIFFVFVLLLLVNISCKDDKSNANSNEVETAKNDSSKQIIDIDKLVKTIDNDINSSPSIIDTISKLNSKKDVVEEKKSFNEITLENKRKQELKIMISKSRYKNMSCKEIFIQYDKVISEYIKSGDDNVLSWKDSNDPFFNYCSKLKEFKEKFDSLETLENSLDDEGGL